MGRLYDAAAQLLDEIGYDELTVRMVAARAGVSPATAYTYFASKDHLCAALYWRQLVEAPPVDTTGGRAARMEQTVRQVAAMLAEAPALAFAATKSLLGPEPEVEELRVAIGIHWIEQFRDALGDDIAPEVLATVTFAFTGALLQAGMGVIAYDVLGDRLADVVTVILRGVED